MQETLYKTPTPQENLSEYYEIVILEQSGEDATAYKLEEAHGWWDQESNSPKHNRITISPEEGVSLREAENMYKLQRQHRAREGFIYSFSEGPYRRGPITIEVY